MGKRKYNDKFTIVVIVLFIVIVFSSGFYISSKFVVDKYSDEEIELCKQIAQTVYEKGEQSLVDVPDNITVIKEDVYVQVIIAKRWGWVDAKLDDNGKIITTYESLTGIRFIVNCLFATLFLFVVTAVIIVIKKIMFKSKTN